MKIRRFGIGDELALHRVFFSAIHDIAVHSGAHPRRGVGRMLMAAIHMEAQRLHLTELVSEVSRTAQGFFTHFGFHIVAQQSKVIRGVVVPNARMQKVLLQL